VNKGRADEFGTDSLTKDRKDFLYTCIYRLMERGAQMMSGGTSILVLGIETWRVDLVKRMIDAEADVNFGYPLAHCMDVFTQPRAPDEKRAAMEKMAMTLLENGAKPNVLVGEQQLPALQVAIQAERINLAKLLVRSGISLDTKDEEGRPVLHSLLEQLKAAKAREDDNKVNVLEEVVAEVVANISDEELDMTHDGMKPLDMALKCGNATVTKALLDRGAAFGDEVLVDTMKQMCDSATPQDRKDFFEKMAVNLIENGAPVDAACEGSSAMDLAITFGSIPVLDALIAHDVDLTKPDAEGSTPPQKVAAELAELKEHTDAAAHRLEFLTSAAGAMAATHPEILMDILESTDGSPVGATLALHLIDDVQVNTNVVRESDSMTPLHCAAKAGALNVVRAIVNQGMNINVCTKFLQTPLMFASYAAHVNVVEYLCSADADPNIQGGQFLPKMTALHEAALRGAHEVCRILVTAGANVDSAAYWGRTPLHFAVYGGDKNDETGRYQCVEALLQGGADLNKMDIEGETGLSYAVERGYQSISAYLLKMKADPCGPDVHGTTPLHHCIERSNSELFNILRESNPGQVETLGLLPWAVRACFWEGVEALTQPSGIVSVADLDTHIIGQAFIGGWMSPLWNAAYFNQIGVGHSLAEVFLSQTQDLDVKDMTGCTLLHRLVHWGGVNHTRFITTLLKTEGAREGANPNIKDDQFFTPLMVAVRIGNEAAAKALLNGGATVTAEEVDASLSRGDPGVGVLLALGLTENAPKSVPHCDQSSAASVLAWCQETGLKFVDEEFPPCLRSLTGDINAADTAGRYHDVEWVRAAEACAGALLGPNDAICGEMGDPFFVATLPDHPEAAFGDVHKCAEGVYEVNVMGQTVVIDDFIPAVDGLPQFTKSTSGLMWPLLYEKAMAKVAGCYDSLSTIRRGELARNTPDIKLPPEASQSARREYCVKEFLNASLSAAALSGHEQSLDEFATFFKETPKPEKHLDGLARAMNTVGNHDKFSFPLRTPALSVKINSTTLIHVDCVRDSRTSQGKMVVCICEVGEHSWKMISGKVAEDGVAAIDLDAVLPATGNKYIVFAGTPVSSAALTDINLDIATDTEVEIDYA
jgi:ankyrin repeat protein